MLIPNGRRYNRMQTVLNDTIHFTCLLNLLSLFLNITLHYCVQVQVLMG